MAKQITKKPVVKKRKINRWKVITKPTIKQQKFIENYLESGNWTDAVIKAWYKCKNKDVAKSIWSENLLKPYIKVAIEERVKNSKAVIYKIAMNENAKETDRIKAAQDVIDRVEWKALARTQLSWELKIVSEDELID